MNFRTTSSTDIRAAVSQYADEITGLYILFTASVSDIDAIRLSGSGGGNLTAGTMHVYAR